ncbi:HEAT repeat domain-containing protein [Actinophytocola xanthii]|uniref:PBS lyase n=1 Tax=Actinophytocola xanthii TaxID=1912961 RepID=A0A1Q8BY71_9PSEU|nr:HEAT repeat domain-containing protein [Actinophytocola xanthii]OLF07060.1 hypothetical protein BU204_35895 [Actinophytocola xanthii]
MLEGLDSVNWAGLRHAYGKATDVPGQIRALRSADSREREAALDQLFFNIIHQGSQTDAAPYAVPFLLEILAAPDTEDRAKVLELLAYLATGYDHELLEYGWPFEGPGETHRAVRAGVPLFRELLRDEEPAVRIRAAYALAWFPENAAESLRSLVPLLAAADELLVATTTVAVGLLGGRADAGLADERPVVRWAAAIACAHVDGQEASSAAVDELLAAAAGSVNHVRGVPFMDGDLDSYAAVALRRVGARQVDAGFDRLLTRIPAVSGEEALSVVGVALEIAFPRDLPGGGYQALNRRQRGLIDQLVRSPDVWLLDGAPFDRFTSLVEAYRLPASRDALADYTMAP